MLLRQAKKNMYERGKARFLLNLALNSWDSVKQKIFWKGMFYADNVFQCWHIKKRLRSNENPILVAQHTHIFALNFKGWIWLSKKIIFWCFQQTITAHFVLCVWGNHQQNITRAYPSETTMIVVMRLLICKRG